MTVICLSQEQSPPTEWTIEKSYQGGTAKWRIEMASQDKVWNTMMRTAMFIKKGTASGDKESGTLFISVPGARIKVLLTSDEGAVDVIAEWTFEKGEKIQLKQPFTQAKIFFNDFFPKVKEALK
jgi:hypothetical protein